MILLIIKIASRFDIFQRISKLDDVIKISIFQRINYVILLNRFEKIEDEIDFEEAKIKNKMLSQDFLKDN
jgi:hypothetical protein